ncbi:MAG: hypothetical protein AB1440_26610 [Pseudomonadota bacterium]
MIGDAMGASLLEAFNFELKRAIGVPGGLGGRREAPVKSCRQSAFKLLGLEIATTLGFNARHV